MRESGSVKLYCILGSGVASSSGWPLLLACSRASVPRHAWLHESFLNVFLAVPIPSVAHPHSGPARSEHPLLYLPSPPPPVASSPHPAIAFLLPACARNSWPCACSRWLSPCCHPKPPAPVSSFQPARRFAAPDQTIPAARLNAACGNPRSFENLAHFPRLTPGSPHPPPISSGSDARKIRPRSTRTTESWSSCADGRAAALVPLSRRPTQSPLDPVHLPRPRQSRPSDPPATTHLRSAAGGDLVQEGKAGKLLPCANLPHSACEFQSK